VTLLDSLLNAIVRLEGDALVMHVGEKPYVVTTSAAMSPYRGPLAWGQVELSTKVLTSDAVLAILGQILPIEKRQELDTIGAVDHDIVPPEGTSDQFVVVAARGGEDVWLELRRKPKEAAAPEATAEPVSTAVEEPAAMVDASAVSEPVVSAESPAAAEPPAAETTVSTPIVAESSAETSEAEPPPFEIVHEVQQSAPTDADVNALLSESAAALQQAPAPEARRPEGEDHEREAVSQQPVAEPTGEAVAPLVEEVAETSPSPQPVANEEIEPIAVEPTPDIQPESVPALVAIDAQPEVAAAPVPAEIEAQPEVAAPAPAAIEPQAESMAAPVAASEPAPLMAEVEPEPEPQRERAVVVPLARQTIRSEVTVSAASARVEGFSVAELLRVAAARGASTVYVVAQSQPMIRADGEINVLDIGSGAPLAESDVNRLVLDLAPPSARDAWQRGASAEWMCDVEDVGRVRWRCLTFREHRGPGLIFRMIPPRAISADQLGLTPEVQALCSQSEGLVLVAGPRASGKSTLMSAFVDLINRTRSDHVVTMESQISFVHESRRSFVSQREVRGDSEAVVAAVRAALREDPDVLLIEDLRSAEIAAVALEAADSGRLVFGSLPAPSTVAAVDRLLELFPSDRRPQTQSSLAGTLRGVVAQVLLRRSRGGRVAAREVLLNTPPVAALIEEGKVVQLPLAMESGRRHGMIPLNDALAGLVREGTVHVTEAYLKAFDKEGLLTALKREGVDTSFAERLA
jgi:twitching motility protein PilT